MHIWIQFLLVIRIKWIYPPFSGRIENGRIYGRGAFDSKGRIASYVMAALALKRSGIPFRGDISIVLTCDEETGGMLGAGYILENKFISGDMVVVEGYSDQIVRAMPGVLQLKIISKGISSHSAWKWKGVNSVEKMAKVINGLSGLQKELEKETYTFPGMDYTTVNIGMIEGGTKINVVPDLCEIEVDFRVTPEHTIEEIYNRVENLINQLEKEDEQMEIVIENIPEMQTEPTIIDDKSPFILEIQKACNEVIGQSLPVVGMLGQTDLRWFIKNGIPGINFGPGNPEKNNPHNYDENMGIDDLIQTTKVLATFARNYLSGY
ncbi:M20 family metallopeptidase [Lentibacillus sp. CBA3610]|uniref:M20 family metallopeptidase n=1 Tax=Lentibacillus sp. CBA3610 TaxID=2518176 RepID=UPI001598EA0D|nr:ArgE/DapE family deacylase [Lentibacillus sp. CBA3610]QKY68299.1 M20 family peptidase [Lentibacillus sp. CBA3610]